MTLNKDPQIEMGAYTQGMKIQDNTNKESKTVTTGNLAVFVSTNIA